MCIIFVCLLSDRFFEILNKKNFTPFFLFTRSRSLAFVDLQCRLSTNRCYACPVGNKGCSCDGNGSCMEGVVSRSEKNQFFFLSLLSPEQQITFDVLGLICLSNVCEVNPGGVGDFASACRDGAAYLRCNAFNVCSFRFCLPIAKTNVLFHFCL